MKVDVQEATSQLSRLGEMGPAPIEVFRMSAATTANGWATAAYSTRFDW